MDERPPRPANPVTPVVKKTTNTVRFDVAPGIKVYWNGKEVDMSRPFPDQKFGTYSLRLEMPGMNPIEQQVQVRPEEPTEIRVR
jgi:hypothetical protein